MRTLVPVALMAALLAGVSPFVSCDNRNIHQVVKEMAAAPVDTVGWPGRSLQTNSFSSVDIDCFADVTYHQTEAGTDPYVELKAPGKVLENVNLSIEDEELKVSLDRRYKMPEKAIVVVNIYAPFVNRFILDGGKCLRLGKVDLTAPLELKVDGNVGTLTGDTLKAHEISLLLEGTGSYHLKGIQTGMLRAKLEGNGSIILEGKCTQSKMTVIGDGKIDIAGLRSDSVGNHQVKGKGEIVTHVK